MHHGGAKSICFSRVHPDRPPAVMIGDMPMVNEGDYVAIFNSIHRVMKAEKLLKREQMQILLIPAPRALASDCGLAIRYPADERERTEALLHEAGLSPEEVYVKAGERYSRVEVDS